MSRFLSYLPPVLELILYVISVSVLVFLSEKQHWAIFGAVCFVAILIYICIKLLECKPIAKKIEDLRKREHYLAARFNDWGLKQVFNMHDNEEVYQRNKSNIQMIERGHQFCLLAESGASYINPSVRRHWDVLCKRLKDGYALKLLLLDPFCDAKKIRKMRNGINEPIDPKINLRFLSELNSSYPNVEIRFTDQPYCSIFINENEIMYDPYHLGKIHDRIENYFLALHIIKKENQNLYETLKSHFDFLWDEGVSLAEWINLNRLNISTNILEELDS